VQSVAKGRSNLRVLPALFVLTLAAATIMAYRPAWNGGFLWDDDAYITNNELLTAPNGLRRIWLSSIPRRDIFLSPTRASESNEPSGG
jgi:hypothetical protein